MPFLGSTNITSECLLWYVIFGCHSTHGEKQEIFTLSPFLEPNDLALMVFESIYHSVQSLFMIPPELLYIANN